MHEVVVIAAGPAKFVRGKVASLPYRLDKIDIDLLNAVQASPRATAEELAVTVALSPSAIARRLRRYRKEGLIEAEWAVVAADRVGKRLFAIVRAQLAEHSTSVANQRLMARLAAGSDVQMLLETGGDFDLLLFVTARGPDELNEFLEESLGADALVRRYETTLVKKRIKFSPVVRLDRADSA